MKRLAIAASSALSAKPADAASRHAGGRDQGPPLTDEQIYAQLEAVF